MQIKIINVEKAKGTSKAGKPYEFIDVTYKEGDKTASKKLFMNDPVGIKVLGFKNGDIVEMTQTKNGDFWEWLSVEKVEAGAVQTSAPPPGLRNTLPATYVQDDQKQLLIVRQNCVGNAVRFHQSHSVDDGVHEVLKTASILEDFVYGRYTPPKEQKEGFADLEDNNIFDDIPS